MLFSGPCARFKEPFLEPCGEEGGDSRGFPRVGKVWVFPAGPICGIEMDSNAFPMGSITEHTP